MLFIQMGSIFHATPCPPYWLQIHFRNIKKTSTQPPLLSNKIILKNWNALNSLRSVDDNSWGARLIVWKGGYTMLVFHGGGAPSSILEQRKNLSLKFLTKIMKENFPKNFCRRLIIIIKVERFNWFLCLFIYPAHPALCCMYLLHKYLYISLA